MEPTIHGDGERVLVQFWGTGELKRYDLVVIDRGGGGSPLVKRVGGLPGDRLQLSGGDLIIGSERAGQLGDTAPPVRLFSSSDTALSDAFDFRAATGGVVTPDYPWVVLDDDADAEIQLDAFELAPGREYGMMRYSEELRDSYLDGQGESVQGTHDVNDASLAFDFRLRRTGRGGRIRARLVEQADSFEAILQINQDFMGYSLRIERNPGDVLGATVVDFGGRPPLLPSPGEIEDPEWLRLSFSNGDNRLHASLVDKEGRVLAEVTCDYEANTPYLGARLTPSLTPVRSVASRVALGGEAVTMDVRRVEISRDLFWLPVGDYGVKAPFVLGPDEYFVLGDNSAKSADSRLWGPIRAESIIGRPTRVVWPLARARKLH